MGSIILPAGRAGVSSADAVEIGIAAQTGPSLDAALASDGCICTARGRPLFRSASAPPSYIEAPPAVQQTPLDIQFLCQGLNIRRRAHPRHRRQFELTRVLSMPSSCHCSSP
jgi:hypothetical protein